MTEDDAEHITEIDAKSGRRVKGMPIVLGLGTFAAVIVVGIVLFVNAT